jgi:hypothetical protein
MPTLVNKENQLHERVAFTQTHSKFPAPSAHHHVHTFPGLQRSVGNRAVQRLLRGTSNLQSSQPGSFKEGQAGLPAGLRLGIENLSGLAMNDVRVHYNSSKPAEVRALAHTQGSNIYVGPGQEKHLPHEAWHVAQQKQGRVKPTGVLAKGASINHDPGLEREADEMGTRASEATLFERAPKNNPSLVSRPAQPRVTQLKKVPTTVGTDDYGQFETTSFGASGRGVEIFLMFHPDETKVDAKKIGLSQTVKATKASGDVYAIDPSAATRTVGSGKAGAGYYHDTITDLNNPLYAGKNLGATEDLKDTPETENKTANAPKLKENTRYILGHCFKEKPSDASKKKQSAGLYDLPQSGGNKGESKTFETAALAIDGADAGKYYGSVKWGFKMEGTTAAPTVTTEDISIASTAGKPSPNFLEPAKLWNKAKTRGTLQVTADPEATVLKGDSSGTEKLAKDTKLKQRSTVMWGADPAVNAEVLKADGTGSGKIVYIKHSDVKDMGDGSETKDLPIPADKPVVTPAPKK